MKTKNISIVIITILLFTIACKKGKFVSSPLPVETIGTIHSFETFKKERIAFGGGHKQFSVKKFWLHNRIDNIKTVKMFIKLDCPTGGCNAWDVFANIKVKDKESKKWFEIGRYITPYGVDNSAYAKGYEIDVTDFKYLLLEEVELRAFIETWGSNGWELSVNFEFEVGEPDYLYYSVTDVFRYDGLSLSGVPYGKPHNFDLTKTITIPSGTKETSLRTIITGWGHATPLDAGGRGCAEWCFRTHNIAINGTNTFEHKLDAIGCNSNPTNNQAGNWRPDRAGWCPGMAVPIRKNIFQNSQANTTFNLEYKFEPWTANNGGTGTDRAFYATSCFVIVKSNLPIPKAKVID